MDEITLLLARARAGDEDASRSLFTELYDQLHRLASQQLRRMSARGGHTTSLVHDVYLRLAKPANLAVRDRHHFYALAGKAMRQVLIDQGRQRTAAKRGEGQETLVNDLESLPTLDESSQQSTDEIQSLEQAMNQLSGIDPDLAQLVELRFYAGLTLVEISELTERSERSLKRDWRKARAYLHSQLKPAQNDVPAF